MHPARLSYLAGNYAPRVAIKARDLRADGNFFRFFVIRG